MKVKNYYMDKQEKEDNNMDFVYCIIRNNEYDTDEAFESAKDAIYAAVVLGEEVAVLDALSLEFYGTI